MLIDENGQPYLAHAGMLSNAASGVRQGVGRGVRQAHKYIMKIGEGAQARYFYTQDEIRAYQQEMANKAKGMTEQAKNTARKVGNKVGDAVDTYVTGEYAKNKRDTLRSQAAREKDNRKAEHLNVDADAYDRNYKRSIAGKAEAVSNKVQSEAQRFKSNQQARREMKNFLNENKKPWMTATVTDRDGNKTVYKNGQALKETGKTVGKVASEIGRMKAEQVANNVKSVSDRMRDELRKRVDEGSERFSNTRGQISEKTRQLSDAARSSSERMRDEFREKAEVKANRAKMAAKIAANKAKREAQDIKDDVKSASDSAKRKAEDIKEKAKSTADDVRDAAKELNSDLEKRKAMKEAEAKAHSNNDTKTGEERHNDYVDANSKRDAYETSKLGKAENKVKDTVKQAKADATGKAKYSEYRSDDPDFDDKNYDEKNRVGDTDFFSFTGKDGRTVIIEEDMKWTLPKGVSPNDPGIKKALQNFADQASAARTIGKSNYTGEEWLNAVNDAINDAVKKKK